MKILTLKEKDGPSDFEIFLNSVSFELATAIHKKLQAYADANEIYPSNSLKILKPRIWGYKGTIYKLRIDCGKESARVMFTKTTSNDIALLHGFIKKTQKTPKKDAFFAIANLDRARRTASLSQLSFTAKA